MTTRKIALIDIENFNGGPIATPGQAQWCRTMLEQWIKPAADEHIVVAADVTSVTNIDLVWPGIRILAGYGENGADLRLLKVMEENLPERFTGMTLVSKDRIFAEKVSDLAGQGLPTHVYSWPQALAKRLRFAATEVTTSMNYNFSPDYRKAA
ncbi:hypothetical protein CPHO_00480 [Corynebacterium phocae]|uniref:NYN domain-containing protein n=1 Tax=Corynebacterium phocae TaxID=161895 RepID=A0A1L7D0I1_9CORY|nr:NYN domain-containing protein [Corynebacterium phocae]APT91655.1 hypothetical protein CPHO_00480 [Corynebacterium phocae]KAA8728628.1 NYN domain-containing protein [Corynebacterium phocae]